MAVDSTEMKKRIASFIKKRDARIREFASTVSSRKQPYVPPDGRCFWHSLMLHTKVDGSDLYNTMHQVYNSTEDPKVRNSVLIQLRQEVMKSVLAFVRKYVGSNGSWKKKQVEESHVPILLQIDILPNKTNSNRLEWLKNYTRILENPENPCEDASTEAWASNAEIKVASMIMNLSICVVSSASALVYTGPGSRGIIVIQHVNNNHFTLSVSKKDAERVGIELFRVQKLNI